MLAVGRLKSKGQHVIRDRRPLALQLRERLVEMIDTDGLRAGAQLPSESDLASRFEVGRSTVREALKLLEQDGRVQVRHGLGRFVAEVYAVEGPITRFESGTEMMERLGLHVSRRVLQVETGRAKPDEAQELGLPAGSDVVRLTRLWTQDDHPLIYSIDVIARSILDDDPAAMDWTGSLVVMLERLGYRLVTSNALIRAVRLPEAVAEHVGAHPRDPWLLLIQRGSAADGTPILYSHDYHRGDLFTFEAIRRRVTSGEAP
jgi:GntR family transcriptional regulator